MKKFYILLALLISLSLSLEIVASSLKVASKAIDCTSIDGKGVASFIVKSPIAQSCDLSFLIMPGEYEDGSFTSVALKVNGVTLPNPITFNTYGWQPANTTDNAVSLNEGDNTIQFISGRDDIPMVKNINLLNKNKYQELNNVNIKNISESISSFNPLNTDFSIEENLKYPNKIVPYSYILNLPYSYTTYFPLSFSETTKLTLYAPTLGDPMFGPYESTTEFNVYVYRIKENNDSIQYSQSISSYNKYIYWQDNLPPGHYIVLIESKDVETTGYVTLRINSTLYRYNFVSNTTIPYISSFLGDYEGEDNIFTTNLRTCQNSTYRANPILWLKEYDEENEEYKIIAYNDDYQIDYRSDYKWDANARIRKTLDKYCKSYSVLLSSFNPDNSISDTCDVYVSNLITREHDTNYPLLKYGDAIVSSSYDNIVGYNCFAWSAGKATEMLFPSSNDISWFDSLYNNEYVPSLFGLFRRDTNLPKLTRDRADRTNAVVAIWRNNLGDITHASIKNNDFSISPHGYDWESKLYDGHRIFHPMDALASTAPTNGYGRICELYRINEDEILNTTCSLSRTPDEGFVREIELTENEKLIINKNILSIPLAKENKFNELYGIWIDSTKKQYIGNDVRNFKNTDSYKELLSYIQNINGECLVYNKFINGDIKAIFLIHDIANTSSVLKQKWTKIFYCKDDQIMQLSQYSKVNLYIKSVLSETDNHSSFDLKNSLNDLENLNVFIFESSINIDITIGENSCLYGIDVIDLQTNEIMSISAKAISTPGKYSYEVELSAGYYVVICRMKETTISKKIIIR